MAVTIEPYAAPDVFDSPGTHQAVRVTGAQTLLFLAGQVAYTSEGRPAHAHDFVAQAREVFRSVEAQVRAGGATLANVVKMTAFLTDMRYRADLQPVREEFFGPRMPPFTLVEVSALSMPEWLVEVEAIAVL